MHALAPERLQAAQHALSAMSSHHVWEFVHPETDCLCRATFDGTLLETEVTAGPPGLDMSLWWNEDLYDDAIAEAENDLAKRGLFRTHVPSPESALRELRLITDAIREIAP